MLARLNSLMGLREIVENLGQGGTWQPAADWLDDGESLTLLLDVPGVDPERLEMQEDDGVVTVAGERPAPAGQVLQRERPAGAFSRTLALPVAVQPGSGEASLRGGVLTVRFRKALRTLQALE